VNSLPGIPEEGIIKRPFQIPPLLRAIVVGGVKVLFDTIRRVFQGVLIFVGSADESLPFAAST
jgi:hypothetical protein